MSEQQAQSSHLTKEEWSIYCKIKRCIHKLRGKSMMYVHNDKEREKEYTTRGFHSIQVAHIALDLISAFGGDRNIAVIVGAGHDYGHSVLAHTGESALGRFLMSPDKFVEWEGINPRDYFDHSVHSVVALERECRKEGFSLPPFIKNGGVFVYFWSLFLRNNGKAMKNI